MKDLPVQTRILIADDQPDVLEALRFLLKAKVSSRTAESPAALHRSRGSREFDLASLMDLNYTRDTTSGQEGLDPLTDSALDAILPVCDDRLGQRGAGGGSHAARGPRFHPEALGQRAALRF